jgi:hypothetical protein
MTLSKKQKAIIWVMVLLFAIILGLQSINFRTERTIISLTRIRLFGIKIWDYCHEDRFFLQSTFNFIDWVTKNKTFAIIIIVLVGAASILTSKKKRTNQPSGTTLTR